MLYTLMLYIHMLCTHNTYYTCIVSHNINTYTLNYIHNIHCRSTTNNDNTNTTIDIDSNHNISNHHNNDNNNNYQKSEVPEPHRFQN